MQEAQFWAREVISQNEFRLKYLLNLDIYLTFFQELLLFQIFLKIFHNWYWPAETCRTWFCRCVYQPEISFFTRAHCTPADPLSKTSWFAWFGHDRDHRPHFTRTTNQLSFPWYQCLQLLARHRNQNFQSVKEAHLWVFLTQEKNHWTNYDCKTTVDTSNRTAQPMDWYRLLYDRHRSHLLHKQFLEENWLQLFWICELHSRAIWPVYLQLWNGINLDPFVTRIFPRFVLLKRDYFKSLKVSNLTIF